MTLSMPTEGKGLCNVLTTYATAMITPIKFDKNGRPTAFLARTRE